MLANSMMQEADVNDQMAQKATQFGVRRAGIDSAKSTRITSLITQASQAAQTAELNKININMSQAEAEAQARANAAAAGVSGDSVDQVINQTEVNAANAQHIVKTEERNAKNQLRADFVDTTVNSDIQSGSLDASTRDQTAKHALAFATGFANSFVPTSTLEGTD